MATKTRAEMITHALRRMGIVGVGGAASAADSELVGAILDTKHAQYRKRGLANFATSAFPEWAQEPFAKVIAHDAAPHFGKALPVNPATGETLGEEGDRELAVQMQGRRHPVVTRFKDF